MPRALLLLGLCGCASTSTEVRPGSPCRELTVEVDRELPTRHGRAENRSPTRLRIDAQGVPHVTWSSQWWRFTTFGRMHLELHHATPAGRRWLVEHDPLPPEVPAPPDTFGHDGARWYVQRPERTETRLWTGPPWRALHTFTDEIVLTQRLDRDGAWLVTTLDPTTQLHRRHRFVAGQPAGVVDTDPPPPPREDLSKLRWPDIPRAHDSFATATRDGRSVVVGVGWQPRGPASERRHPHGEPYTHYPNPRRGHGTLVVWGLDASPAEPRVVRSVRLRDDLRPQVELGPDGAIHILLADTYSSDFAANRYVKLRCR